MSHDVQYTIMAQNILHWNIYLHRQDIAAWCLLPLAEVSRQSNAFWLRHLCLLLTRCHCLPTVLACTIAPAAPECMSRLMDSFVCISCSQLGARPMR